MIKQQKSEIARRRREVRDVIRDWPAELTETPRSRWPPPVFLLPLLPAKVWLSRRYLVYLYPEANGVQRLTVCRAAVGDDGRWQDGITWDELQAIKAAVGFGDAEAVEIYPADRDVVNVANFRHLWILPEPLPFTWRSSVEA